MMTKCLGALLPLKPKIPKQKGVTMKRISKYRGLILAGIILTSLFGAPSSWQKAKIEKKDGLAIIHNPKGPVQEKGFPSRLSLKQDLCIGKNLEGEDYMFSQIGGVAVDVEEDIIVIDEKEIVVKVFDKTGKHIRTFGKRGQGPGEFASVSRIVLTGGKDLVLLDASNGRFSYYSKEGKCLKEIKLGKNRTSRVKPDSRGFIYADTTIRDGNNVIDTIVRFNPEFENYETVAENKRTDNYRELNPISEWYMYSVIKDDRFIWGRNTDYEFTILNQEAKPIKKIIRDYDPVKITKEEREKIIAQRFGDRGVPDFITLKFPDHYTPWYYFICDDVGGFYVRTFEKNDRGQIKWDYFDKDGVYRLFFFLPPEELLYDIRKNKAYSFINENEDGIPIVIRYLMEWR
jgi:hypothetical protein